VKQAAFLLLMITVLPAQADGPAGGPPEFYFTRLMYSGNAGRSGRYTGFGGVGERECATLRPGEGGGGAGRGSTWATDYPASDCKFMWGVERLTGVNVYARSPHTVAIMDPKLFDYPYLYAVEVGRGMDLSEEEAQTLREYLLRGGFLHIDDFWGPDEKANFEYQMEKIFPDREIKRLDLEHEVFGVFFDIDRVVQIPGIQAARRGARTYQDERDREPVIYGISDDTGRLMVVVTYNSDLGDAWEWMDDPEYPEIYSGQAYRMGVNFIIYSMTH
jgi:hypothetical protein